MAQQDLLGQVHVAVIRLDGKVDGINQELRRLSDDQLRNHTDHEGRLRVIESSYVTTEKFHEVANRPYVSPATVWKIVGSFIAFASLVVAIIGIFK